MTPDPTSGPGYYVRGSSWPAPAGPQMTAADIERALASMDEYYDAAVLSIELGEGGTDA